MNEQFLLQNKLENCQKELEELEKTYNIARRVLWLLEQQAAGYTILTLSAERQLELEEKRTQVTSLKSQIDNLKSEINALKSMLKQNSESNHIASNSQKKIRNQPEQNAAQITPNIINGYDLETLICELCRPIKHKGGAFAFTLGGNPEVLDNYVMERICKALQEKIDRVWKRYDINIYTSDLWAKEKTIEERLKAKQICQNFSDLFSKQEQEKTNILLVIWNGDIPLEQMSEMAVFCWQDMEQKTQQFLVGKSRCFVVIWANVLAGELPLNNFTLLPVPDKFEDVEDLADWFGIQLEKVKLSDGQTLLNENEMEKYKRRIKSEHGDLVGTYREIRHIIQELQKKQVQSK